MALGKRRCVGCGEEKDPNDFYRHATRRDGLRADCKRCHTTKSNGIRLKRWYGLTPAERDTLFARGCDVCGTRADLAVDHDHATGRVRGALCRHHNTALGLCRDDPAELRALADYLERSCVVSA